MPQCHGLERPCTGLLGQRPCTINPPLSPGVIYCRLLRYLTPRIYKSAPPTYTCLRYLCLVSVLFVCSLLCGLGLFWWFTMIFCGFVFIVKLELAAILPWWFFYNSQSMSRMLKIIVITGFISMINIFLEQLVKIRFLIYKTV